MKKVYSYLPLHKLYTYYQGLHSGTIWRARYGHLQAPLLCNYKEIVFFIILLLVIFLCSLLFSYYKFLQFKKSGFKEHVSSIQATVLNQYIKISTRGKPYTVLKLQNQQGTIFYTTTKDSLKNILYRDVRINIITKKIDFFSYLKGFYAPNISIDLLPQDNNIKHKIRQVIQSQHNTELSSNLYQVLFLGDTLNYQLRKNVNALGIAHLFALSGFHYGVIALSVSFILYPFYYFFQKRFFPYRNAFYDIGFIILIITAMYLLFLEQSPSFFRAFAMACWAYLLILRGIKLESISSLCILVLFLIALFPSLIFSIGFIFSIAGVFYILLFIKYYSVNTIKKCALLQIGIYFYMIPIVHYYFNPFSLFSLLSIIITPLFAIFYPIACILHIIGYGGIGDTYIEYFASMSFHTIILKTHWLILSFWFLLSIAAIFNKKLFWVLNSVCFFFFLYNLANFLK